jgi:hypothetical protein
MLFVLAGIVDNAKGNDNKPMSILSYANGPKFDAFFTVENGNVSRVDLKNFTEFEAQKPVAVPLKFETHSGADVGIFASG